MPSLAITGNLGGGKSTALGLIHTLLNATGYPAIRFSADEENRRLLEENREVQSLIRNAFGEDCFTTAGSVDREKLFHLITTDPEAKSSLEQILHPRLESLWKPLAGEYHSMEGKFFLAEIPLLFEKGLDQFFNLSLVVACSESTRRERVEKNRSLTPQKTTAWLALQQDQEKKISKAEHVLWNDGSMDSLNRQISLFLSTFCNPLQPPKNSSR